MKFELDGIVQARDTQFQGNSIKGARHIISFDARIDS
jgi:hypothetical protein